MGGKKRSNLGSSGFLCFASITFIGLALRLYRLGHQSLWLDEVLTYLSSSGSLYHVFTQTEIATNVLPFYYFMVHPFLFLGQDEFVLRLPSLIVGSLSVPLFFLVVRQHLNGSTALWASSLMAISPFHIYYCQEARPYALFVFICLLSLWFLAECIKREGNRWLRVGFAITAAATFYCHTAAIPFIGFMAAYVALVVPRKKWGVWILIFIAIAILLIPGLIRATAIQVGFSKIRSFEPSYLAYVLWAFSTGFSLGPNLIELHRPDKLGYIITYLPLIVPILVCTCGLALHGAIQLSTKDRTQFFIFTLFFFLPIIFMSIAAFITTRPFNVRHVIPSFLPFLLFVSVGIRSFRKQAVQAGVGGLVLAISVVSLVNYYFNDRYYRDDNRRAGEFLTTHAEQGDLIICMVSYSLRGLQHYSPDDRDLTFVGYPERSNRINVKRLPSDLQNIVAGRKRFWVFYCRTYDSDPWGRLRLFLGRRSVPRLNFRSNGVELMLYEKAS